MTRGVESLWFHISEMPVKMLLQTQSNFKSMTQSFLHDDMIPMQRDLREVSSRFTTQAHWCMHLNARTAYAHIRHPSNSFPATAQLPAELLPDWRIHLPALSPFFCLSTCQNLVFGQTHHTTCLFKISHHINTFSELPLPILSHVKDVDWICCVLVRCTCLTALQDGQRKKSCHWVIQHHL